MGGECSHIYNHMLVRACICMGPSKHTRNLVALGVLMEEELVVLGLLESHGKDSDVKKLSDTILFRLALRIIDALPSQNKNTMATEVIETSPKKQDRCAEDYCNSSPCGYIGCLISLSCNVEAGSFATDQCINNQCINNEINNIRKCFQRVLPYAYKLYCRWK